MANIFETLGQAIKKKTDDNRVALTRLITPRQDNLGPRTIQSIRRADPRVIKAINIQPLQARQQIQRQIQRVPEAPENTFLNRAFGKEALTRDFNRSGALEGGAQFAKAINTVTSTPMNPLRVIPQFRSFQDAATAKAGNATTPLGKAIYGGTLVGGSIALTRGLGAAAANMGVATGAQTLAGAAKIVGSSAALGGAMGGIGGALSGQNIGKSALAGAEQGVKYAPTYQLTNLVVGKIAQSIPALKPLTDAAIEGNKVVTGDTVRQALLKTGDNVFKRAVKAAFIETPFETIMYGFGDRREGEKLIDGIAREFRTNLIFNLGFAGVNSIGDAAKTSQIVNKSMADALEKTGAYKLLTTDNRGFVQIPGSDEFLQKAAVKYGSDHTKSINLKQKYGEIEGLKVGELLNEVEKIGKAFDPNGSPRNAALVSRLGEIVKILPKDEKFQAEVSLQAFKNATPNAKSVPEIDRKVIDIDALAKNSGSYESFTNKLYSLRENDPLLVDTALAEYGGRSLRDIWSVNNQRIDRTQLTGAQLSTPTVKLQEGMQQNKQLQPPTITVSAKNRVSPKNLTSSPLELQTPRTEQPVQSGSGLQPPQELAGGTARLSQDNNIPGVNMGKVQSRLDKLYTATVDRFHPLFQAAKNANSDAEMRNAITRYYGAGSTGNYHVNYELAPILRQAGSNVDDMRSLLIAKHDLEWAKYGMQGSPKQAEAPQIIENIKQKLGDEGFKNIDAVTQKLYDYQNRMAQTYLVDTGIISKSSWDAMRQKYGAYVPFRRVMDDVDEFLGMTPPTRGAGSISSQDVVMKAKGSSREIIDPLESIIENSYKMVSAARRQRVAQTIVGLKNKLPAGMIEKINGKVGNQPNVALFENGEVVHYRVPTEIADAARGLSEQAMGTLANILSYPTRLFRATATGYNPEFMVPNIARDLQSAFVNAGLNPIRFVRGLAHLIGRDELYQQFLKEGGQTSRVALDQPYLAKTVKELTGKGINVGSPKNILRVLQIMGEWSEQPTRIAVFEDALRKGKSPVEAANIAQEATTNFARRGAKTSELNAVYAFVNARLQGTDKFIRTLKSDPVGTSVRLGASVIAPALVLQAWNSQFDSYEDKRIVPDYEKENNFIIMFSDTPSGFGGAQYFKIPKGDIGRIANPLEEFISWGLGKGGDIKKSIIKTLAAFSPVDLTTEKPYTKELSLNWGSALPTTLKPLAEVAGNKSFFTGYEIVPEYKKSYPAQYQASNYTSPTYRAIADNLAKLGIQVSPAIMQHLVESYGTGLARGAQSLIQPLIPDKYVTPQNERGADINRKFILRRFMGGEKQSESEYQQSLQGSIKALKIQIGTVRNAIERGDISREAGTVELQKLNNLLQEKVRSVVPTITPSTPLTAPQTTNQNGTTSTGTVKLAPRRKTKKLKVKALKLAKIKAPKIKVTKVKLAKRKKTKTVKLKLAATRKIRPPTVSGGIIKLIRQPRKGAGYSLS